MLDILVVWAGTIAWLTSVLTIGFGLYFDSRPDVQHSVTAVGGIASAFFWFVFAFGATSIQVPTNGVFLSNTNDDLALLGAGLGVAMLVLAWMGTAFMLNVMDIVEDDRF